MSKQLLAVIAGAVVIWGAYTVSDRLMADHPTQTQNQPVPGSYPNAANSVNAPAMIAAGPVPDPNHYNLPADHALAAATPPIIEPAQSNENSQFVQPTHSPPAGVVVYQNSGRQLIPAESAAVQRAELAFAGKSGLGSFSVVSDGERSIMVNTTTGDSWLLMIDDQGSRWEQIKMRGAAEQASLSPWGTEARDEPVSEDDDTLTESKLKQAVEFAKNSAKQKDQLVEKLRDAHGNIGELRCTVETIVEKVNALNDNRAELKLENTNLKIYVEELKKQLKEAEDALRVRDRDAQAEITDASEVQ